MASDKTPGYHLPSMPTSQISWGVPFCRNKFCLAYWLLSSVVSLVTSQILKIFLTTWGLAQDFTFPTVLWISPTWGCIPLPVPAASGLGESTLSMGDRELKIKSQLAMLGKGAGPSKHINSMHRTKVGKSSIPLVVGTSQREAVWVRLGLVSDTKQVLTPDSYSW
jgi:hypothetical protein